MKVFSLDGSYRCFKLRPEARLVELRALLVADGSEFCDVRPFQGHRELSDGSAIELELQAEFMRLVSLATTGAPDSACSALFLAVASQGSRESKTTISNGSMRSSSCRIRSRGSKLIDLEPAA